MNAIVDIIRSIPSSETELYPYHNYDIVFSGDFNVNMLQRFPQGVKYPDPDGKLMEPYFFKCVKVPGQKTIISTTKDNYPSAFATESNTNNYNTTNIDFSVFYPALVESASTSSPIPGPISVAPASSLPLTLKGVVQVREGKGTWTDPLIPIEVINIFAPIKKVIDVILDNPLYEDYYIGLTYSANRGQTSKIFKEYGFTYSQRPSSSSTMPPKFTNVPVAKILEHISGSNQANVVKDLYNNGNGELVTNQKYKNFRIIPFSTMEGGLPAVVPTTGKLGDESDSMNFVDLFLTLPKTIIIGWTSSMSTKLITSNKDKQGEISNFKDLVIAIGGGIAAGNVDIQAMVTKYINLLISKWDEPSQKFVNSILGIAPIVSTHATDPVPGLVTKYVFAFDIDNTLLASYTIDGLSMNVKDVQYRQEIIQNMRKVIESNNYVWIVTANSSSKYTKKNFCSKFFESTDEDFFNKSEYFYFMNPDIIAQQYKKAKKEFPLEFSSDTKLGSIYDLTSGAIHKEGLKPYCIYAQSLITKKEYNGTHTPKIGDFNIYLFDDMDNNGTLSTNSKSLGINFTKVTDFTTKAPNLIREFKKVLDDGISKIGSVTSTAAHASASTSAPTPATTLKVMSFNTWFPVFTPKDHGKGVDTTYCHVTSGGNTTNECQKNVIGEIIKQIGNGFQVIFLQEFTSRIQKVFEGFPEVAFSDTKVPTTQIPFTMTYTPPGGSSPLEYYVYTFRAGSLNNENNEVATTLCLKSFFPAADKYFMGNLVSIPNHPIYAKPMSEPTIISFKPEDYLQGGSRPYVVLVFHDRKMILINIHAPHYTEKFDPPYLSKLTPTEQQKIKDANAMYDNQMKYAIINLGKMLRKRISSELQTYSIIFGGDFNMTPPQTQEYLVMLSDGTERIIDSSGSIKTDWQFKEGPFSNSSGKFDKIAENRLPLKIGNTSNNAPGTCCVYKEERHYDSGVYDQIYSNNLKITGYWTYNSEDIEYDKTTNKILFSDHLPVYAEIKIPESAPSAPSAPSSGGSKRLTLRNNSNNNSKSTSRKIRKHASTSMPTTRFTKKQHIHNKRHKTRRHKH